MKRTKKSLWACGLSLLVCLTLLVETTFAWFTDSVTNKGNRIQAGSLDVVFEQLDKDAGGYKEVTEDTPIFNYDKWEPGYSISEAFRIGNNGSLALKYQLDFVVNGEVSKLANVIDVYYMTNNTGISNENLPSGIEGVQEMGYTYAGTLSQVLSGGNGVANGHLKAGESDYAAVILHMQESAGNEYMGLSIGETFDVVLKATQYTSETDGFGSDQYDKDAEYPVLISTVDELEQALLEAEPGDVLQLENREYQLDDSIVIPDGVTLEGVQAGKPASQWVNDENAPKTVIVAPDTGDRVIEILQDDTSSVSDVVIDGIYVDCDDKNVKGIFVKKTDGDAMQGIVVRNCAVVDSNNDGIDVSNTDGAVIEGNYVSNVYDDGISLNSYNNTGDNVSYVRNNVVENISGTINGAIAVSGGKGDVVVSNNTISNIGSAGQAGSGKIDMGESAITIESVNEGGVITVESNNLTLVSQGIAVYKFSAPTENDKVIIQNNNITDASRFAVGTSTLNYANYGAKSTVEIQNNIFEDELSSSDVVYVELTNRYGETTQGWAVTTMSNTHNGSLLSNSTTEQ